MNTKELLQQIDALALPASMHDCNVLAEELELLERAHAKLEEMAIKAKMAKLATDFGERDTDVYIVTFPKSGTTLMQMLLYQLTTDGSMDFGHIYDVSPWCRYSAIVKQDMRSTDTRRLIKTHDDYAMLSHIRKGKFIVIMRDCLDVVSSFHQHIRDYVNPSADLHELWNRKAEAWVKYNMEWIKNEQGLDILYLNYEDIVQDKLSAIQRIADFLSIKLNEEIIERTLSRTSIAFMKEHEQKFGEQPEHWKVYNNFIRNGKVGEGKRHFTAEQLTAYKTLLEKHSAGGTPMGRYL